MTGKRAAPRFKIVPSVLKPNQAFQVQFENGDCTPGTYEASMTCDNIVVKQSFEVAGRPKAKAPVVKPKGAPQTGGGGTA